VEEEIYKPVNQMHGGDFPWLAALKMDMDVFTSGYETTNFWQ
jgi:hypothetical protein